VTVRQPRYSKEEFARWGDEIYESQVRQQVEEGNHGKIVAIDIAAYWRRIILIVRRDRWAVVG
jgi:hypothetical protein